MGKREDCIQLANEINLASNFDGHKRHFIYKDFHINIIQTMNEKSGRQIMHLYDINNLK